MAFSFLERSLEKVINVAEAITGQDLDRDGDVAVAGKGSDRASSGDGAKADPQRLTAFLDQSIEQVINVAEHVTGQDLDRDGDVGVAGKRSDRSSGGAKAEPPASSLLEKAVNVAEGITGLDLDRDGDVGVSSRDAQEAAGAPDPAEPVEPEEPDTRWTLGPHPALTEADAEAQAAMMALVGETQKRLRQGLAECSARVLDREQRILSKQHASRERALMLEQQTEDAKQLLAIFSKEEMRLEVGKSSEVAAERRRLDAHTASLQRTHEQTRRLQEDLMAKRENFVVGREALQGALEGLQEERFDMHDWFYMPAARLTTSNDVADRPFGVAGPPVGGGGGGGSGGALRLRLAGKA